MIWRSGVKSLLGKKGARAGGKRGQTKQAKLSGKKKPFEESGRKGGGDKRLTTLIFKKKNERQWSTDTVVAL